MLRAHPLWRGFFLAAAMTACRFLLGEQDALSPFRLERKPLAFVLCLTLGTVIASVPRWLRRKPPVWRSTWQCCLRAFLCGGAMALAFDLCGSGGVIPGLMTGAPGALAFAFTALATGFTTRRILERRRP